MEGIVAIGLFFLGGVFVVVWYLLRQKDARQEQDIITLYELHHKDVAKLAMLELEIAKNHYPKTELDQRFSELRDTIKDGFRDLSSQVGELSKSFNDHLKEHGKK